MLKVLGLITAFILLIFTIKPKNNEIQYKQKNIGKPYDSVPLLLRNAAYNIIKPDNNIIKITDNLYISDYYESIKYDELKNLGIKQILSIGKELPEHNTNEFKLKHIKIDDSSDVNIMQYFEDAHNFIDQGSTLVHCYAGISRSASIIISYLMKQGMTYEEAYNYVKERRPIINPNRGFKKQLMKYELYLKSNN
jgi:protein tyrosine phosphatase (PTP) superfamily phosphohydrolase (DUF442 family)